jgi:putative glutamine amidotransferase
LSIFEEKHLATKLWLGADGSFVFIVEMARLATWVRAKDDKWFQPFFDRHPDMEVSNALHGPVEVEKCDGLLLTGGADIAPELLRQSVPDPGLVDPDFDLARDRWEFDAVANMLARGRPIFAICKGLQVLNVALDGTLKLDIPAHNQPEQKDNDVQPLRTDAGSRHRFEKVNSSHHQAIDSLGEKLEVEPWCATDDIIEQVRLRDYPFALAVQYHPERGRIYDALFEDFFARVKAR